MFKTVVLFNIFVENGSVVQLYGQIGVRDIDYNINYLNGFHLFKSYYTLTFFRFAFKKLNFFGVTETWLQ